MLERNQKKVGREKNKRLIAYHKRVSIKFNGWIIDTFPREGGCRIMIMTCVIPQLGCLKPEAAGHQPSTKCGIKHGSSGLIRPHSRATDTAVKILSPVHIIFRNPA